MSSQGGGGASQLGEARITLDGLGDPLRCSKVLQGPEVSLDEPVFASRCEVLQAQSRGFSGPPLGMSHSSSSIGIPSSILTRHLLDGLKGLQGLQG
eukprot:1140749-Pelagomonas_calceolata.AAC.3